MKDLHTCTLNEICWLLDGVKMLNMTSQASKVTKTMERDLHNEFQRRGGIRPLSVDLCRSSEFKKQPALCALGLVD